MLRWMNYVRGLAGKGDLELRTLILGLAICSAIVFLGSQTEGRFLEDPYLWLFAGLAVAIEQLIRRANGLPGAQSRAPLRERS
jgi:hypothetical protein